MGIGPSSTATSTSSTFINGVEMTITDSSSCAWYNPVCSGASANTSSNFLIPANLAFISAGLTIAVLLLFMILLLWIAVKTSRNNRNYRRVYKTGGNHMTEMRIMTRSNMDEIKKPLVVRDDLSKFVDVPLTV